jgi:hypothetical protein
MPIILDTQKQRSEGMRFEANPGRVHETLSPKKPSQKRAGEVAQGVGPEFKPQYCKKKKKERERETERVGK